MLHVRTVLSPSRIHGFGVFADQYISKGAIIWTFEPKLDLSLPREQIRRLPALPRAYLKHFAYLSSRTNRYVLCFDNARYFNHSDMPNTRSTEKLLHSESVDIAVRNIFFGEELTTDYGEFDIEKEYKLRSVSVH